MVDKANHRQQWTGALAAVTALSLAVGVLDTVRQDPEWYGHVALIGGAVGAVIMAAREIRRRRISPISDKTVPYYSPNVRMLLGVGAALAVLVAVAVLGFRLRPLRTADSGTTIVIAQFGQGEPDRFRTRDFIAESLREALRGHDVSVRGTSLVIDASQSRAQIMALADSLGADILVWGWSAETDAKSLITIHVEVAGHLAELGIESSVTRHVAQRELIHTFELQEVAASQTAFSALLLAGIGKYVGGDCGRALSVLDDAERQLQGVPPVTDQGLGNLYAFRADTKACLGKAGASIPDYERAMALLPRHPLLMANYAQALLRIGDLQRALRLINYSVAKDSSRANAYHTRGRILADLGQLQEANDSYRAALRIDPANALALNSLAISYLEQGMADSAIYLSKEAIDSKADFPHPHIVWANALVAKGDTLAAIEQLRTALRKKRNFALAHSNLSAAFSGLGMPDSALSHARSALEIAPGYTDALVNLGLAHHSAGKADSARAAADQALRAQPDHLQALILKGVLLLDSPELPEALQVLTYAVELSPRSAAARYSLCLVLDGLGRDTEEQAQLDTLLKMPTSRMDAELRRLIQDRIHRRSAGE